MTRQVQVRAEVLRALIDHQPGSGEYELAKHYATPAELLAARWVIAARMRAVNIARVDAMAVRT